VNETSKTILQYSNICLELIANMSVFDITTSQERAQRRFGKRIAPDGAARRSDRGRMRISSKVTEKLIELLGGYHRRSINSVLQSLNEHCAGPGLRPPSRASVYKFMATAIVHAYPVRKLPAGVRQACYNISENTEVPGHQLAFYCFNYGGVAEICFAAGLPWLDLYQAVRMRGWRPASHGLLDAVMLVRRI